MRHVAERTGERGFRADAAVRRFTGLATAALAVFSAEVLVYSHFFVNGRSLVWQADGMAQHFPAFYYARQTIGSFLADPRGGYALWSWQLGFGADVIGTLSYYLADPFAWLALLFPLAWAERVYFLLYLVRILVAGVAGYLYLRKMRTTPFAAIVGTLIYTFSMFTMFSTRHPYFIDAMVWFPLILLGIEKVLERGRWYLLAISAAALAASNIYFFYQVSIVAIVYAVARWLEKTPAGKRLRRLPGAFTRVATPYALGVLLAAGVLLPVVLAGMSSTRTVAGQAVDLLQDASGYRSFLVALAVPVSGTNSAHLGFSIIAFMAAPLVLVRKGRDLALKTMLVIFPATLLTPLAGTFMNTMEFPSYRFMFMWGLFLGCAVARVLSRRGPLRREDLAVMAVSLGGYGALATYGAGASEAKLLAVLLTFLLGCCIWAVFAVETHLVGRSATRVPGRREVRRRAPAPVTRILVAAFVLVGIAADGAAMFHPALTPRIERYLKRGTVLERYMRNPGAAAAGIAGPGLARVDNQARAAGADLEPSGTNDQLVQGYKGVSFYYSLMDGSVFDYVDGLQDRAIRLGFDFSGLDGRAALESLAAVRFYIAEPEGQEYVPYGFEPTSTVFTSTVYENRYPLPAGFVYHASIPRAAYERLRPLERQQAMLQAVVVEGDAPAGAPSGEVSSTEIVDLPYTVEPFDAHMEPEGGLVRVRKKGGGLLLQVPPVADAELYLHIRGIRALPTKGGYLSVSASTGGIRKTELMHAPSSGYFHGNDEVLINLGHFAETPRSIYVMVGRRTRFHYRDISVRAVLMSDYPARIAELADEGMTDVSVTTDTIAGTVAAHSDGLLYLSVPYSPGWKVTVDGRTVPTQRVNVAFTGIPVASGRHRVVMRYRTPGLDAGLAVSGVAVLLFAGASILTERRRLARGSPSRLLPR